MPNFSAKTKSRAWIAVVHTKNMESIGLSEEEYKNPEYLATVLSALWEESGKNRSCAVSVCVSAEGLYHAHMALYGNTTTLKKVSDILFQSHVEPQMGGKKELTDYMLKQGAYEEKGETVLYSMGMDAIEDKQGKRSDLELIEEMLLKGMTPQQILSENFRYYHYEKMILHAYCDQKMQDAPIHREIYCEYHLGASGSGKTYTYNLLCEKEGADQIYIITDYDNNASGGLDAYMKTGAPPILFMDEFKGYGLTYGKLLTMLNGYSRMQTHARYANAYNLWEKVYITSVYPPEEIYKIMVDEHRDTDSYTQLIRRINKVVFHYVEDGQYKTYAVDGRDYKNYEDLRNRALACGDGGFRKLTGEEMGEIPFKEAQAKKDA